MATYYVDYSGGNDGNTGLSVVQAWRTVQHALDTAVAADEIRLLNNVPHVVSSVDLAIDTNSGTTANAISIYGADSAGDRLGGTGKAIIDLDGSFSITCAITQYMRWRDVRFTNSDADGWSVSSSNIQYIDFLRCEFDSCGSDGFYSANSNFYGRFSDCDIHDNTAVGINTQGSTGYGNYQVVNSRVYDNGTYGIFGLGFTGRTSFCGSVFYGNGSHGLYLLNAYAALIYQNTFYGNGGSGLYQNSSAATHDLAVINNSFVNNGVYGLRNQTAYWWGAIEGNHFHANVSGDSENAMDTALQIGGDPLFNDPANGDFTPQRRSPLIGAGVAGADIGAISRLRWRGGPWSRPVLEPSDIIAP